MVKYLLDCLKGMSVIALFFVFITLIQGSGSEQFDHTKVGYWVGLAFVSFIYVVIICIIAELSKFIINRYSLELFYEQYSKRFVKRFKYYQATSSLDMKSVGIISMIALFMIFTLFIFSGALLYFIGFGVSILAAF